MNCSYKLPLVAHGRCAIPDCDGKRVEDAHNHSPVEFDEYSLGKGFAFPY